MTADRVDELGALANQPLALARQHQSRLLVRRFRRHEAHLRPACRLAQRRRIGRIVLAARHIGLGELWRDQPHRVSEPTQFTGPMMRRPARLHRHHRRRQPLEEGQRLGARQLAAQRRLFARIDAMKLKETLRRIHPNARNLIHGRLLSDEVFDKPHHGNRCRSGAVHPNNPGDVGRLTLSGLLRR
jgi:hypothetical protein